MTRFVGILSAKGGVGKCVSPDTPILTNSGKIFPISTLFDRNFEIARKIIFDQEGIFIEPKKSLKILTMDCNLKIKPSKVKFLYKGHSKNLFKVTTKRGKSVKVTPRHRFFVLRDGKLQWIEANNLRIGDFIATPRITKVDKEEEVYIRKLSENILVKVKPIYRDIIKENLLSILERDKRFRYKVLYKLLLGDSPFIAKKPTVWSNIRKLIDLKLLERGKKEEYSFNYGRIIDYLLEGIPVSVFNSLEFDEKLIESLVYENRFYKKSVPVTPKVLKLNKNFVDFISILIAEGAINKSYISIENMDDSIINKVIKICVGFNLKYDIKIKDKKKIVTIKCGMTFNQILSDLFEIPIIGNRKSFKVKIPNIILNSKFLSTYLSTLIDCDGYINKRSPLVEITTASKENAIRLHYAFLQYGIVSSIKAAYKKATNSPNPKLRKYYFLSISGSNNFRRLSDIIKLEVKHKRDLFEKYLKIKNNTNIDSLPLGFLVKKIRVENNLPQGDLGVQGTISDYENGRNMPSFCAIKSINTILEKKQIHDGFLKLISNSDLFFDRVKTVGLIKHNGFVYDLTVEGTHNFIAGEGGFISHNTSTTLNLGAALNHFGRDVIIVDGNLSTPNLGLHLGVYSVPISLHDVLKGKNRIEESVYMHNSGIKLLPAGISLKDLRDANPDKLRRILPSLDGLADIVLVDGAAGLGREALAVLNAVDDVLIITNPEIPSVTDSLKTIKIAEKLGKAVRGIIVTRTGSESDLALENVAALLGKPIIGVIPEDDSMKNALSKKSAVIHTDPKSRSAIAYKRLAAYLIGLKYEEKYEENFFTSFLRRLRLR